MNPKTLMTAMVGIAMLTTMARPVPASQDNEEPTVLGRGGELVLLTDFASLLEVFEQDKGSVRLVALLSPSCGYCIKGYRYMRKILDEISDERLKMYIVWEPMLSGDSRNLAAKMARKVDDPRMVYQAWDEEKVTGKAWAEVMSIGQVAWDVYLLYEADAEWRDGRPSQPGYWQHQGAGGRDNWLDYDNLKANIEQMLARAA